MRNPKSIYYSAIYYATIHYTKAAVLVAVSFGLFAAAGTLSAKTYTDYPPFENQVIQVRNYAGSTSLDRHECRNLKQRNLPQPAYCIIR